MAIYTAGRRRTMLILLLTSILLITLDLRGNAVFNAARTGFGYALRPFEIAGEVVTRPVERMWSGITQVDDLERENAALQRELDKQRSDQVAGQAALEENRQLRAQLDLDSLNSIDSKTCSIIGSSPSNFDQRVEIDCGSLDGLRVGMPVVNEAGLVGKITTLSLDTSVVMLVTDPLYSVQAKVVGQVAPTDITVPDSTVPSGLAVGDVTTTTTTTSTTTTTLAPGEESSGDQDESSDESSADGSVPDGSVPDGSVPDGSVPEGGTTTTSTTLAPYTRETGVLEGLGGDRLPRVRLIDDAQQFGAIEIGDAVLTAGGSDSNAPPNLPIGTVINVINELGVSGLGLEVELNADLDRLNFLTVILYIAPREAAGLGR
jgi:rod shape-determining protein MreC